MRKFFKIVLLAALVLLVVLAGFSDRLSLATVFNILNLSLYLRLASLLGLLIALFAVWGYKIRLVTSQKYRRADQVLADAQAAAKRRERASMLMEEKLKAEHAHKTEALNEEMTRLRSEHREQIMALKAQNMQLKEAVSKLLRTMKKMRDGQVSAPGPDSAIRPVPPHDRKAEQTQREAQRPTREH